ncbi:MAG: hypothetical protein HYT69_02990 [Candidatus Zambryskibacteria bacterium]|nr:hypothetical protein [Candidatus Zambryskibacteria bacterium]
MHDQRHVEHGLLGGKLHLTSYDFPRTAGSKPCTSGNSASAKFTACKTRDNRHWKVRPNQSFSQINGSLVLDDLQDLSDDRGEYHPNGFVDTPAGGGAIVGVGAGVGGGNGGMIGDGLVGIPPNSLPPQALENTSAKAQTTKTPPRRAMRMAISLKRLNYSISIIPYIINVCRMIFSWMTNTFFQIFGEISLPVNV